MINHIQIIAQKKGNATFAHKFDAHPIEGADYLPASVTVYSIPRDFRLASAARCYRERILLSEAGFPDVWGRRRRA